MRPAAQEERRRLHPSGWLLPPDGAMRDYRSAGIRGEVRTCGFAPYG